jgi:hypothetical protein
MKQETTKPPHRACRWCRGNGLRCLALSRTGMLYCTRPRGHPGRHRACGVGLGNHPMEEWAAARAAKHKESEP